MRVRHQSHRRGTAPSVKLTGTGPELLIRFEVIGET